jgi:peptidoglycan hydrolase CwlO-like protein
LEAEKAQLEKDKNDIKRQLVSLKTHWSDLETQIKDLKQLLDRVQTFKACLGNLGKFTTHFAS